MLRSVFAPSGPGRPAWMSPLFAIALGAGASFGLQGCSNSSPDGTGAAPTITLPVASGPAQNAGHRSATPTAVHAADAFRSQRLFAPVGDNAFELYLEAITVEPGNVLARNALTDLFPYAVMHVEQRLQVLDAEDASRVLGLMQRADPAAPALPRLGEALEVARARLAAESTKATPASTEPVREATAGLRSDLASIPTATPIGAAPPVVDPALADAAEKHRPPADPSAKARAESPHQSLAAAAPVPARVAPSVPPAPVAAASVLAVLSQTPPRYPPQAQRRRIEGQVELEFTVGTDGRVSDVQVVRSEPEGVFEREAIGAMQRWRFAPPAQAVQSRRVFDFKLAATAG